MEKTKKLVARAAILAFAAAAAFYSVYVAYIGRMNVTMGEPDAVIAFLARLASSAGRAGIAERISRLRFTDLLVAAVIFAGVCFGGEICFRGEKRAALRRGVMKGIAPALLVLSVLWVAFRLNNTSLYAWNYYLGGNDGYPLFGAARLIRWDEYSCWTPMALSQEYIGWPQVNTLMGSGTDITWVSMGGVPAWSAATPFKPLYWGFLLLGADCGLSFLSISRIVLLFAVSWKTAMLYTKGSRGMSLTAAVILTLSPMVQWFISQSIAEVLIFGQGIILSLHALLQSEKTGKQFLWALLTGWQLGCLVMTGYPAWIIPAAYLVLAAGIWMFTRRGVANRGRKAGILLLGLLPSLAVLGAVVYSSWDTLMAIKNSAYPGSRVITGAMADDSPMITGAVWNAGFKTDLASVFFPLGNVNFGKSNCADASPLLGFAPAGLVLSVEHQWREKKADPFAIIVASVMAFFWLFTFIPLPAWLCKITLLSQCSRPIFPIGICEVILLVRARAKGGIKDPLMAAVAAAASTVFCVACVEISGIVHLGTLRLLVLIALYLFMFFVIYLDFKGSGKRLAAFFMCCVLLLAGGFVNPVQGSIKMLDGFDLIRTVKSIENEPGDLYAIEGEGYPVTNALLLTGKHCINSDQPYADLKRWEAIDPDHAHDEVFNRLCHIIINLAEPGEEREFVEKRNHIYLRLTREDLAKLGVNYLITPRAEVADAELVSFVEADGLYIWKLR